MGKMLKEVRLKAGFYSRAGRRKDRGHHAKTIQRYETGQRKIAWINSWSSSLFGVDYTSFISAAKRRLSEETSADFAGDHQAEDGYYLDDEVAKDSAAGIRKDPNFACCSAHPKDVSAEDLRAVIALVDRMKKEDD